MLFTNFMKLYHIKNFDRIAISVGSENYVYYLNVNIDSIVNKYGQHIVVNIDYDPNTPSVLYVELRIHHDNYFSLRKIRDIIEANTRIIVQDIDGEIIDEFDNRDSVHCFYDSARVVEYYFLNDVFYVKLMIR